MSNELGPVGAKRKTTNMSKPKNTIPDETPEDIAQQVSNLEKAFGKDVWSTIERYRCEYYVTYEQLIGALQMIVLDLHRECRDGE